MESLPLNDFGAATEDIKLVTASSKAFAAIIAPGSVVTWGDPGRGAWVVVALRWFPF